MNTILPIIFISSIIALLEIPSILRKRYIKELVMFLGLLIFALVIGIMQGLKIKVINPFDILTYIFSPMTTLIQKFLK